MDPIIGGAIIGGVSNLASAGFGGIMQGSANKANKKIAREQMRFQERMSNTAVQRHAEDLEKAGFNRLLAAGGQGASTPTGASATMQSTWKGEKVLDPLMMLEIQKGRADISKTRASEAVDKATVDNIKEQNKLIKANTTIAEGSAIKAKNDSKIEDSWYGKKILSPARTSLPIVENLLNVFRRAR